MSTYQGNQLQLALRLARRQIAQRYRQTLFGGLWAVINPLLLLLIYWFVFSTVFPSRWDGVYENVSLPLIIFSGLIFFNLYAEIVNGSTTLVQNNALLIKRTTVGPKVIPISAALTSLFTFLLSLIPFFVMYLALQRSLPPVTTLLAPLVIAPLFLLSLGLGFILASISAYFRDLQQIVPLLNTGVLFVSPIFFPADRLPGRLGQVSRIVSPLVVPLEASKQILFLNELPNWTSLTVYSVAAAVIFGVGWKLYGVAARGFGDVV